VIVEDRFPEASIHGRFQPFHLDHLEYALAAKKRCDYLWVGLTAVNPISAGAVLGSFRLSAIKNPLTYSERVRAITAALVDSGLTRAEFGFVPFPIEHPGILPYFLPVTVPCFTTICEEWNREKVSMLEACGYRAIILWEREQRYSATAVRERLISGDPTWRTMVPGPVAALLDSLRIADRLRSLNSGESVG
jgi:nicotinamide mononucleotide adenylyltransferase